MESMLEKYTQELMVHTSKTFQTINFYSTKSEEASIFFLTDILFASAIIIIFSGIFYIGSTGY